MSKEIETKLRVDSFEAVAAGLKEGRARLLGTVVQLDSYYDSPAGQLVEADKCLRIRRQEHRGQIKRQLTYKGPKERSCLKSRLEVNIELGPDDAAERMLEGLGFSLVLGFEKQRQLWKLDGCEISLDKLPLIGTFVEIEGPSVDVIQRIQHRLGLGDYEHVSASYADMIQRQLGRADAGTMILLEDTDD